MNDRPARAGLRPVETAQHDAPTRPSVRGQQARDALRAYLEDSGLAGAVKTTPSNTLDKCRALAEGNPDATFGLGMEDVTVEEAADAVRSVCGADPRAAPDPDGPGWIDPEAVLDAIDRHVERLADVARRRAPVLVATGHPTGLLAHYMAIARALQARGCSLLTPLDGQRIADPSADGERRREVRFLDGVGCVSDGASLRHTHRDTAMRAMLASLAEEGITPALVVADHGLAGAAITGGLATLSVADVNDVALPLAQVRGLTDAVMPLEDNITPRSYTPLTEAMLEGW